MPWRNACVETCFVAYTVVKILHADPALGRVKAFTGSPVS